MEKLLSFEYRNCRTLLGYSPNRLISDIKKIYNNLVSVGGTGKEI